jgi:P-type Cu2+ transporter
MVCGMTAHAVPTLDVAPTLRVAALPPTEARPDTTTPQAGADELSQACAVAADESQWARFGWADADPQGMQRWTSVLALQGLHCAGCAAKVEAAARAIPGVHQAQVSGSRERLQLTWVRAGASAGANPAEADRTTPVALVRVLEAVAALGYRAVPALDALAQAQRRTESRRQLWAWAISALCMMQIMMFSWPAYTATDLAPEHEHLLRWAQWVIALPLLVFGAGPFIKSALRDMRARRLGMDVPVALGMVVTFGVSTAGTFNPLGAFGREVYFDSLSMFVFILLSGRWLEARLRHRTAGALEALVQRLPDTALRQHRAADGRITWQRVAASALRVGDVVQVQPGEAFCADGVIVHGHSHVDEALLTGEPRALERSTGQGVLSGSHNLHAVVQMRVTQVGDSTRFAEVARLMASASVDKPQVAQWADRVAQPFLWAVLLLAAGAAAWGWSDGPAQALMLAAAVLVVTCPCALSLATPATLLAAAGQLARQGVLVRRLGALERLASVQRVVFDKTGTLTDERFALQRIITRPGLSSQEALNLGAALAAQSRHPVAQALARAAVATVAADCKAESAASVVSTPQAATKNIAYEVTGATEHAGQGVQARVVSADAASPITLRLGQASWAAHALPPQAAVDDAALGTWLGTGQDWWATFVFDERLRPDAARAVAQLQAQGLRCHMLSGDRAAAVQRWQGSLKLDSAVGGASPSDKLHAIQAWQGRGEQVAMVGDGLNDGPVLAAADVSFAMAQGVPLAQAQADVVLLGEHLSAIPSAVALARRTVAVLHQNLAWAAVYNLVCVPLALAGWLNAWQAGLGMAISSVLVVANASRLSVAAKRADTR